MHSRVVIPTAPRLGRWLLPQPVHAVKNNQWVQIPRPFAHSSAPYGYKVNEQDPMILDPIPEELAALEKARKYLKKYKSREVAAWLSKTTGRRIAHNNLLARFRNEQRNQTKAATLRAWARRYKKAILLAEKFDNRPGKKKKSILEEFGVGDWGRRDQTLINVITDDDGNRRVYKLCGCKCEHCSTGTEHNLQAKPGATDLVSGSE